MTMSMWLATRDDDPKKDPILKVLHAAQVYTAKFGMEPNCIDVSPKFPQSTREQLQDRFTVLVRVPIWSPNEIRVGRLDDMKEPQHKIKSGTGVSEF